VTSYKSFINNVYDLVGQPWYIQEVYCNAECAKTYVIYSWRTEQSWHYSWKGFIQVL